MLLPPCPFVVSCLHLHSCFILALSLALSGTKARAHGGLFKHYKLGGTTAPAALTGYRGTAAKRRAYQGTPFGP